MLITGTLQVTQQPKSIAQCGNYQVGRGQIQPIPTNIVNSIIKLFPIPLRKMELIEAIGTAFFFVHYHLVLCVMTAINLCKAMLPFKNTSKIRGINPVAQTHSHVFSTLEQVIRHRDFLVELYQFQTKDGAYVTMWRINPKQKSLHPYPIILQHGLLDCSATWFLQANKSDCLPYLLAEQGYDVWVGNNRGTKLSQRNGHRDDYWDYTFDHLAQHDVPAMIEGVLKRTQKQKIIYIGHSQGSTQFLAGIGIRKDITDKVACFIGFGTVISFLHLSQHIPLQLLARFNLLEFLLKLGFKTLLLIPNKMSQAIAVLVCNSKLYHKLCMLIINYLCGFTQENKIDQDLFGVILAHEPGGASIKNVLQWVQCYRKGKLSRFDFGSDGNMLKYGQKTSPEYCFKHLKEVPFHSYLFRGQKDAVMPQMDFTLLTKQFDALRLTVQQIPDYHHLDYLWSRNARTILYDQVCAIVRQESR